MSVRRSEARSPRSLGAQQYAIPNKNTRSILYPQQHSHSPHRPAPKLPSLPSPPMPRAPTRGPDLKVRPKHQPHPHLKLRSPTPLPSEAPCPARPGRRPGDTGPRPRSSTAAPKSSSPHTSRANSPPFRCPVPRHGPQTSKSDRSTNLTLTSYIPSQLPSPPMPPPLSLWERVRVRVPLS